MITNVETYRVLRLTENIKHRDLAFKRFVDLVMCPEEIHSGVPVSKLCGYFKAL